MLFENRYFDASLALGMWYIWILTQFYPFSNLFTNFCSFPPHPLLARLISPHYTKSTGMRVLAKVVGHSGDGHVELEYYQNAVWVVNHGCHIP